MKDLLNGLRTSAEVERVPRSMRHYGETRPPSWEIKRQEDEEAYRAERRLENLGKLAQKATDAVIDVHDHINSKGDLHPAVDNLVRRFETLTGRVAEELLIRSTLGQ